MSRIPEYDDGYDSKESFERAECDAEEDLDDTKFRCLECDLVFDMEKANQGRQGRICNYCAGVEEHSCQHCGRVYEEPFDTCPGDDCPSHGESQSDLNEWVICPACRGDGHHAKHLGAFTQSEFNEFFDDEDSREGYFAGWYDRTCGACGGTGKLRRCDLHRADEEEDRHNRNNSRFNDAGEPL